VKNPTKDVVGFHISPENTFEKDEGISVLFLYANERGMSTIPLQLLSCPKFLRMPDIRLPFLIRLSTSLMMNL